MKTLTSVVLIATMLFTDPPKAHALFGHTAEERQRRITAEQQFSQEHQRLDVEQRLTIEQQRLTSRWQITTFALGVGAILALIIGTAIGSKARRDHES